MHNRILDENFFERDANKVALSLLGKYLVRKMPSSAGQDETEITAVITEVEIYDGYKDKASHAHRGMTKRNAPMFGQAGIWYVYLCYGIHYMLNIVVGPKDYPAAVLIRGVSGANGPGRVTKKIMVNNRYNNKRADRETGLWIEDRGIVVGAEDIIKKPRVGVDYAGSVWSKKEYRFILK